jgi:hypothetical protein
MDALLAAMALWLAANFGLPPIFDLPNADPFTLKASTECGY